MQLKDLQHLFIECIRGTANFPEGEIVPGGALTEREALNVYAMDYNARMRDALGSNYEATWQILGDEEFSKAVTEYIQDYPSTLANLTGYGEGFPETLTDPDALEMARFERHFWALFHADDSTKTALTPELLENTAFDLSAVGLFKGDLRLDLVFQHREDSLSGIEVNEESYFVVFKAGPRVEVLRVSPLVWEVLSELRQVHLIKALTPRELSTENWMPILEVLSYCKSSI